MSEAYPYPYPYPYAAPYLAYGPLDLLDPLNLHDLHDPLGEGGQGGLQGHEYLGGRTASYGPDRYASRRGATGRSPSRSLWLFLQAGAG